MNLRLTLRQVWAIVSIYIQEGFAYRASGVIWILTDMSTAVTMPFLWIAAAADGPIKGFGAADFVAYYVVMLFVASLVQSHFMWEIGYEVREGIFSSQLIRPMNWYAFMLARNLAWRVVRTFYFIPFAILMLLMFWQWLAGVHLYWGWEVWVLLFLGHALSICFVLAMGLIALFTQETDSIFGLYYFPMLFLSGRMFPVDVMPDWVRVMAIFSPFYYTTGAPTEAIMGRLSPQLMVQAIGWQLIWITLSFVAYKFIWSRGLRQYTGVGM
ncbi:MAG: ABC-2 family transporter protein [Fimbriimonadaceae bacterium]|nr:ABC-2 family transporter protein [Fimbriimonadaceae bacterium]